MKFVKILIILFLCIPSLSYSQNMINGHEFVDLALPSGTLWATCNVGASIPSDFGSYFAWGETSPKPSYDWYNLKYFIGGKEKKFSKYVASSRYGNVDNKTELEKSDDAANVNWGGTWRMPTKEEWVELNNNCKWEWTTKGNHNGYLITSTKNNNSIFLPAAGWYYGSKFYGADKGARYWSATLYMRTSYDAYNYNSFAGPSECYYRYFGQSVRPVASSIK